MTLLHPALEPPLYYGIFLAERVYDARAKHHRVRLTQSLNTPQGIPITIADLANTFYDRNGRGGHFIGTSTRGCITLWDDEIRTNLDDSLSELRRALFAQKQLETVTFADNTFHLPPLLQRKARLSSEVIIAAHYDEEDAGHTLRMYNPTLLEHMLKARLNCHQP